MMFAWTVFVKKNYNCAVFELKATDPCWDKFGLKFRKVNTIFIMENYRTFYFFKQEIPGRYNNGKVLYSIVVNISFLRIIISA